MSSQKTNKRSIASKKNLFTPGKIIAIMIGTALISFGMYNIHEQTSITEGGVLGMILFLNYWTGISPAFLSPILDFLCYAFAIRFLGWDFLKLSVVSSLSLAGFFKLWELFPPVLPNLSNRSLLAAIIGGVFVGIGVGLVVRQGGSSGGDDALALAISKVTRIRLSRAYLATDITVLLLSLSYIPLRRIFFSLVTVTVSSLLIEYVQNLGRKNEPTNSAV